MAQINVTRSSMPDFDEYCNEIKELWDSRWLTNNGVKHRELQEGLEEYLGVPHVSLFTNGHIALEFILEAMNFPRGSEIITTPFTFASTTHAITRCGYTAVFCDVNADDFTIDVSKIEALITENTVAILPVHVYGNICDTYAIDIIAKKHGLKVIYDAAHAFGVTVNSVNVACFGDASMFSFHATKVFNTVEGGAVCFADDSLVPVLDSYKNFGLYGEDCTYAGGNGKMSEFHAAMGICNLRHISGEIAKRKNAADEYVKHLEGVPGIRLNLPKPGTDSNYAYFPVIFDGYKYSRDEVQMRLAENGVIARKYFYPATNEFSCYMDLNIVDTPIARELSQKVLTLPLYADLSVEDVKMICRIILE